MLDQQSRASYFAKAQGRYEFYINLLMCLHELHRAEGYDDRLALRACERGRSRALLDILDEARADIRHGLPRSCLSASAP